MAYRRKSDVILIDGLNFSGKTLISRHLVDLLSKNGIGAKYRHGLLTESTHLVDLIKSAFGIIQSGEKCDNIDCLKYFDEIRSLQLKIDCDYHLNSNQDDSGMEVLLVDRHWFSHYCHLVMRYGKTKEIKDWRNRVDLVLKMAIYITCNPDERRRRAFLRANSGYLNPLGEHMLLKFEQIDAADSIARKEILKMKHWSLLDTSSMNAEMAAQLIYQNMTQ